MGFFNALEQELQILQTYPCETQEIYVMGLKDGQKLISYDPFIIFSENTLAVGLDNSFHQFYLLDKDGNSLKTITLNWNDQCNDLDTQLIKENTNLFSDFNYEIKDLIIPSSLLFIVFMFIIKKVIYAKTH